MEGPGPQFELGSFDVVSLSFFPTFSTSKDLFPTFWLSQAYAKKKINLWTSCLALGGDHMPLTSPFRVCARP